MKYIEPTSKDFPAHLLSLSWQDLKSLAAYHQQIVDDCLQRAKWLRGMELMHSDAHARADALATSPLRVAALLANGYNSLESAIEAVARELSAPEDAIKGWWKIHLRKRDAAARAERNKSIIELVRLGLTNEEIARRMGVNRATISRAIGEHLHGSLRPVDRARLRKRRKPNV